MLASHNGAGRRESFCAVGRECRSLLILEFCAHPAAVVDKGGSTGAVVVDDVERIGCGVENVGVDAANWIGQAAEILTSTSSRCTTM